MNWTAGQDTMGYVKQEMAVNSSVFENNVNLVIEFNYVLQSYFKVIPLWHDTKGKLKVMLTSEQVKSTFSFTS